MQFVKALLVSALCLAATSLAQVTYYHGDPNPVTGGSNTIPWSQPNGYTTLHVYKASQLLAAGVSPGAVLTDFAINPSSGTMGTYNAPMARMLIGHVIADPLLPTTWEANLDTPTVVHDLTSGPYTFPWTISTWVSLPGFLAAGFAWDGVRDIGVYFTSSAGTTGTFSARQPGLNGRFGVTVHNATNSTPTTTGFFAMKARMVFTGTPIQTNSPEATMTANGSGAALYLYGNETLDLSITSTTAAGQPFFLAYSPTRLGGSLSIPPQALDIGSPFLGFADTFLLIPGGTTSLVAGPILPLAALDALGNFALPLPLPCGVSFPRLFLQAVLIDPTALPTGLRVTGSPSFDLKPGCRFASADLFPIAIPDAGAAITSTVTVPFGTPISDLDVLVDITHLNHSDLTITLDNGTTTINLMLAGPVDATDLGGRYQFSDESPLDIQTAGLQSGTLIVPGRYLAEASLTAFDGLDAGGTWTLSVTDTVTASTGSLTGFSLVINGTE